MSPDFRLIAATYTPFTDEGSLRLEMVAKQAASLSGTRVNGVFVAGTTGEGSSLTVEERRSLAQRWCEVASDHELDVIVHVGHNCQADACLLAAHAVSVGADAVAAHAPCFFRPRTVENLLDFLVPIARAAADLPFYFYDIPGMTGVRLGMVELLEKGKQRMPNLVGLKYSNDNLVQLQECVQLQQGEFEVLFGCDEMLLAGIVLGISGAVGSTYNFACPLYEQLLRAVAAGDWETARTAQARSVELVQLLNRFNYLPASKALMSMLGVDCGPLRPPLGNLSPPDRQALRAQLDDLGFFSPDWARVPPEEKPASGRRHPAGAERPSPNRARSAGRTVSARARVSDPAATADRRSPHWFSISLLGEPQKIGYRRNA